MTATRVVRRTVIVTLENGLHMVPCSEIAKSVRDFSGRVQLRRDKIVADARSVLDLLQLKAEHGTRLEVEAEGDSAEDVVGRIERLFEMKFEVERPASPPATDSSGP